MVEIKPVCGATASDGHRVPNRLRMAARSNHPYHPPAESLDHSRRSEGVRARWLGSGSIDRSVDQAGALRRFGRSKQSRLDACELGKKVVPESGVKQPRFGSGLRPGRRTGAKIRCGELARHSTAQKAVSDSNRPMAPTPATTSPPRGARCVLKLWLGRSKGLTRSRGRRRQERRVGVIEPNVTVPSGDTRFGRGKVGPR